MIPRLELPNFQVANPWAILSFVGLGIIMGLAAALFIKSLYAAEDFFEDRVPANYYVRHASAMFLVGVMFYAMLLAFGHYYVEGVGYATVQDILTGKLSVVPLLLLLFVLKMCATSLTLGSGASGGVFSPSFFMGAALGGAYGVVLGWMFPALKIDPAAFAVAGMAGLVGGATGAAMAAIVMIFEMTLDYNVIIPITITVALSYGIRKVLCPDSIYTLKLTRRGHHIPSALHANLSHVRRVKDIMQTGVTALPASCTLDEFARIVLEHPKQSHFLVHDGERIVGVAGREAALGALDRARSAKTIGQAANTRFVVVSANVTLADLLGKMFTEHASVGLVAGNAKVPSAKDICGIVTEYETADAMIRSVDLFCD